MLYNEMVVQDIQAVKDRCSGMPVAKVPALAANHPAVILEALISLLAFQIKFQDNRGSCYNRTNDINKAHKIAKGLKTGTVWVNCHNIFDAAAPFGGYKLSGFGRDMGVHALESYTQVKNVILQLHQV